MNVEKAIIRSFAIVLFLCGVYCPEIEENELPSQYPLLNCSYVTMESRLYPPSPNYMFEFLEGDPDNVRLREREPTAAVVIRRFPMEDIEFISMEDKKLKLIMYQTNNVFSINCEFTSLELAQKFYKRITRNRQSESTLYLTADYLRNSDGVSLAEQPDLRMKHLQIDDLKIVIIKNNNGDPVLIFPRHAITEVKQNENDSAKVDLYIKMSRDPPALYTFGFPNASRAAYLIELFLLW